MPLRVAAIVEGHGEDGAVRPLLQRVWFELLGGDHIEVVSPIIRRPQGTLLKEEGLKEAVDFAGTRLSSWADDGSRGLILILIDSEGALPCQLGPKLLTWAKEARADTDIACILPNPMFETWFVAAANSLAGYNDMPDDLCAAPNPEGDGLGKRWIKERLKRKYKETVDQPRFASKIDLALCRQNSPSFDKLCRDLEARLR